MADQVHFSVLMYIIACSESFIVEGGFLGVTHLAPEEVSSSTTLDWITSHD